MTHGSHGSIAISQDAGGCLLLAAHSLLDQCEQFVSSLPAASYSEASQLLGGGTIGKHLRHLLDHYFAISTEAETIVYDHRARGGQLETDPSAGVDAIRDCRLHVARLCEKPMDQSVAVQVMTSPGTEVCLRSTIAREIAFATHHAVHHQAMMRAIAKELQAECLDASFGVAPSTIDHERRIMAHAVEAKPPVCAGRAG